MIGKHLYQVASYTSTIFTIHIYSSRNYLSYKVLPIPEKLYWSIGGSLILAIVSGDVVSLYDCHKGFTLLNIPVVCSFYFIFQYILAGLKGSAHDSRVLESGNQNWIRMPEGNYYLGDAGCSSPAAIIAQYRGVRYHLKEQGQAT